MGTDTNPIRTTGISSRRILELINLSLDNARRVTCDVRKSIDGVDVFVFDAGCSKREYQRVYRRIADSLSEYTYGFGDTRIVDTVSHMLLRQRQSLALAESLTGGLISDRLTDIPGSSGYFMVSLVVYSNESKVKLLGVPVHTIERWGAVSRQTCDKMLKGLSRYGDFSYRVAVTGIAGPTGGVQGKPVGTVYVGIADHCLKSIRKFGFSGTRRDIKEYTFSTAMRLLWKRLKGITE